MYHRSESFGWKLFALTLITFGAINNVQAERLWSHSSIDWTPKTVSIGVHGTQVFAPNEFGQDRVRLLSGFSPDPAPAVWQNDLVVAGSNMKAVSAESADVHMLVNQVVVNGNNSNRRTILSKYDSGSSTPRWTYTFPETSSGLADLGISRDGSRIVAVQSVQMQMRLVVAIFSPDSGTPISTFQISNFGMHLTSLQLSADGSTLYLSSNGMAFVYNLANNALIHQMVLSTMMYAHAICGNGDAIAWGDFYSIHLYQRNSSGGYTNTWNGPIPSNWVPDRIVMSDDCSTLAYGMHEYSSNLAFRIKAIDIQSKQQLMQDECTGTGTFQNVVSDMAISADGSRFAVGAWGDGGNVCSELRVYDRNSNAPRYQYNYPGSVYALDMNADGTRVAVGAKPVHANTFAGGGSFDLHAVEEEDIRVVGIPWAGGTVQVRMNLPGNSPTRLLVSSSVLEEAVPMGNMGDLWLPRLRIDPLYFPNTNSQGEVVGTFVLPAGAPGQDTYLQGISLMPRTLTGSFVHLRTLPMN